MVAIPSPPIHLVKIKDKIMAVEITLIPKDWGAYIHVLTKGSIPVMGEAVRKANSIKLELCKDCKVFECSKMGESRDFGESNTTAEIVATTERISEIIKKSLASCKPKLKTY